MFPIEGMAKPTFIAGYGTAIISFEWYSYLNVQLTDKKPYPPPVATFRDVICPDNMEISLGKISPLGSVLVGNCPICNDTILCELFLHKVVTKGVTFS